MVAPFDRSGIRHQVSGFRFDFADGDAAVREQDFSHCYGGDQLYGYLGPVAGGVIADGAVPINRDHTHRDTGVGAGDAPVVVQRTVAWHHRLGLAHGYSILEALSSSNSCSYSAPICSRARRAECASPSSSLDMAKPTWMSTQSPTSIRSSS